MRNFLFAVLFLLPVTVFGQAVPAGHINTFRVLGDFTLGGEPGYKLPFIEFGSQVEIPLGNHFEAQAHVSWSPTAKDGTSRGSTWQVQTTEIVWLNPRVGITGNVRHDWLTTNLYHKEAWEYSPGVVFRFNAGGSGHRIYVDYLLPYGNRGFNAATGIEDSHTQGPEGCWEVRMASYIRMITCIAGYHVLTQGNQYCDGTLGNGSQVGIAPCPRSGAFSGAARIGIRFEWPKNEGGW